MSVNNLKKILVPPQFPIDAGELTFFRKIEKELGTSLPSDYKDFIINYGVGSIDDFIWVLNPFVKNENLNLINKKIDILKAYQESKDSFPNDYDHEIFPNKGGLFPWGLTDNGDELYWLTEGKPDNWKVVVYETRSPDYHTYPFSMTQFLYKVLTRELKCDAFPDDIPSENPSFVSE